MKRKNMIGCSAVFCFLMAACTDMRALRYRSLPPNPFPDIQTVAVLPVANHTSQEVDAEEFANILSDELLKFGGFRVVRPAQIRAQAGQGERFNSLEDVLRLAARLKADAVLAAAVTNYDPYYPPRLALSVQLLRTKSRSVRSEDIDRMVQSASWNRGPIPVSADKAGNVVAVFEEVYDAQADHLRDEVAAYSRVQSQGEQPFAEGAEFLMIQNRFWQFVSTQAIFTMIAHGSAR